MPVGMLQVLEGGNAEIYDAVNAEMDVENNVPQGLIIHTAGPIEFGWQIFDVWESREDFDRFAQERLGPAVAKVSERMGMPGAQPSPPHFYELHKVIKT